MRKLIVSMNVTLDGYLSGPNCEMDWHFESWTKDMGDALCSQLSKADTIILGGVTYRAMATYWPLKALDPCCRDEDFAFANMMNSYTKIVFSKTIGSAVWNNARIAIGGIETEIRQLKKTVGKDIIVYGSARLVDALINLDLVDEYQLWIHPVILGDGKSLFKKTRKKVNLKTISTQVFTSGVVIQRYRSLSSNKKI